MATCTLVTAYYNVRSKRPPKYYMEWAKNFLTLPCPIVLFTSPDLVPIFKGLRGGLPIYIFSRPFESTVMWSRYKSHWEASHGVDHEKNLHSPQLYSIWANKSAWVKEAIQLNPFHTSHYVWCDIGAFRDASKLPTLIRFPMASRLPEDKVLFCLIEPLQADDFVVRPDGIPGDFRYLNRIVGGLWGGPRDACLRWAEQYEAMLNRYIQADRFIGKDQSIMMSAILEDSSNAVCIRPHWGDLGETWFYLEYYLSDPAIPCDRVDIEKSRLNTGSSTTSS